MLETILITIFVLLFIWIAWWKLDWAIVLTVLFLPTYLLRFQVWFLPMTILEVMVLIIFTVWAVKIISRCIKASAAREQSSWLSEFKNVWCPWKWLTLLFILTGVVAVLISPDIRQALGLWKAYILEPLLFFIVFVNVIKTKQQIHSVIWGLGALTVVVGYVALLQYAGLVGIPAHYGLESPPRATSVFPFPTAIGKLVGPLVALFFGLWLARAKQVYNTGWDFLKGNIFISGVLLFGLMGLFFSISRGALIGVLAALIFISFFSRWKRWIWLGLVFIVILAMLIPQTRSNILGVFNASDVSTDVRLVMWQGAVRIIQDNPITGTGLASFPRVYEDYKEASHTEFFPNPDHLFLTLWIEMGLAGLILFIWLVIRFFKTCLSLLKGYKAYAVGLSASMVALIIHGFFDTPYFKNDLAIVFWVLAGLAIVIRQLMLSKNQTT